MSISWRFLSPRGNLTTAISVLKMAQKNQNQLEKMSYSTEIGLNILDLPRYILCECVFFIFKPLDDCLFQQLL